MATTSRLGLSYPQGTDPADVPAWMLALATELDGMVAPMSHGTLATRPVSSVGTPGLADRLYWANDVDPDTVIDRANVLGELYRDNGTGWDPIGPFASKLKMGTFLAPGTNGNQDITGLGFQPKLVEFDFSDQNSTTLQSQSGKGAMDGSTMYAMWSRSRESSGDSVSSYTSAFCIYVTDLAGSIKWKAVYVSMLADGFRINWQDTSGGASNLRVVWKAWG